MSSHNAYREKRGGRAGADCEQERMSEWSNARWPGRRRTKWKESRAGAFDLLDISTIARGLATNSAFAAVVAPVASTASNADAVLLFITVDADEVTTEVVLPAEGATARAVRANMRLQPVGVVGSHVSLQIVGSGEGCEE